MAHTRGPAADPAELRREQHGRAQARGLHGLLPPSVHAAAAARGSGAQELEETACVRGPCRLPHAEGAGRAAGGHAHPHPPGGRRRPEPARKVALTGKCSGGRARAEEKTRQLADVTGPGQPSPHPQAPGAASHGTSSWHLLAAPRALWPHERAGTESPGPGMWRRASGRARAPGGPALPWTPAETPHWTHRQRASPLSPAWVGTAPSAERQKAPTARPTEVSASRGGSCVRPRAPRLKRGRRRQPGPL